MEEFFKMQLKKALDNLFKNTKASELGIDEKTLEHCKLIISNLFGQKINPQSANANSTEEPKITELISVGSVPFITSDNGSVDRAVTMSLINAFFKENPSFKLVNIETIYDVDGKESGFRYFYWG